MGSIGKEIDRGRYLHLIFFVGGVEDFSEGTASGISASPDALAAAVRIYIQKASENAKMQPGFREGLSIFVAAGIDCSVGFSIEKDLPSNWRLEAIPAHDLVTLGWLHRFDRLSLWRLLDAHMWIELEGTELLNLNGILNLIAWSRKLDGHLVPHGQIPDEFSAQLPGGIWIGQNALRNLRHDVMLDWDPRRVLDAEQRWVPVRKLGLSPFDEDRLAPLYASEQDVFQRRLRAVYTAPRRPWWLEIEGPEDASSHSLYEHWKMLCVWLQRAAPLLDEAYRGLPAGPMSYVVHFATIVYHTPGGIQPKSIDELRGLVHVSTATGSLQVQIEVESGFEDGLMNPENIAERVIVEAMVAGAAQGAGEGHDGEKQGRLVSLICPSTQARYMHRFEARTYRDFVQDKLTDNPILIDKVDDAASRLGLGWRDRSRESGPNIVGKSECTSYLNSVVKSLIEEICSSLHGLDRRNLLMRLLHNHELAARDREVWLNTAQAALALRNDRDGAVRTIILRQMELNACTLTCRILLEAAVCGCPINGGRLPGDLDISRLMAKASLVFHVGGWSHAVHWGAMEAHIRVTPFGDVHMDHSFEDSVLDPHGRITAEGVVQQSVETYAKRYSPVEPGLAATGLLEAEFLQAWHAEFGISLDAMRLFIDRIERVGVERSEAIVNMRRSELRQMISESAAVTFESAASILGAFTLTPRLD